MNTARILVLSLALLAAPAIADDAITLDERVKYYDVKGLTQEAIAHSLRRDAPRDLDGFQGQANFWFAWNYEYRSAGERDGNDLCRVVNTRVDIRIVVTLPRHRKIADAPDELEAIWQDYAAAMEAHERNHAEDFVEIGSKIPEAIDGLVGPCRTIEDIANAKGMEYVDRAQKAADDYDAETNHGETEGTVFPGL